ncbi:MAG: TetR/AcrR family transcriptional regulator [Gammaproteobacteria bacterium]|uniref:TetR/AcrR family transcriptional regulator n=1 Tax=Limnobacter sp. TaxID=2003368 RepID=UPI001DB2905B|nr:TetR/AcrR family transcriptional regulator [Limnobacter sp.]MBU0783362.1 TetR/AcrR family transcriptional regulator [Gammaproteobacteria bacterium]MBU0850581.1 TetR/AcrR family transcriptional regulator [Gammaproteobacteria bacterium]MBU1268375.1 TetR/AcrR family transcriptional regulator [Gammaproteobacteria bacterium]MBU1530219.1 TetR/AcrR family transcriptional regulator [Gammaproteobacteria bacterium]MBU1780593.1 TetR/AcrR family transcriptional regulator [Gammaproteobacteria bacterium]
MNMVKVDGRTTRGHENKKQIVLALIELIREGHVSPTAEMVSARAGVGLRTVFRHFKDMETLYREISSEVDAIVAPVLATPVKGDTAHEKLMHAIERRTDMFEKLAPIQAASLVHLHESEFLKNQQARTVALQRYLLRAFLPAQIVKDKPLFEALDLILSFESWLRLRRDQQLGVKQARKVLQRSVEQLLK